MRWGNIYWGGALFCFIADLQIRSATQGKVGLKHALKGVISAGGNIRHNWTIREVLDAADQSIGLPVLNTLYTQMATDIAAGSFDLAETWRELGVVRSGSGITLDDRARKAWLRKAILKP